MHEILFYRDRNGKSPVVDYLREIAAKKDKDSRIKSNKINGYIEYLAKEGQNAGEPLYKAPCRRDMGAKTDKGQNSICGMGRKQLYTPSSLHKENAENPTTGNRTSKTELSRL